MMRFITTLGLLTLVTHGAFAASYGKDTRYIHAHRSPGRGLSGSLGSPSRSKTDVQEALNFFDENQMERGCQAIEQLLKKRLLTSEELAHVRSVLVKQSPELFTIVCQLQFERTIIDDLMNKRTHVKIDSLDKIIGFSDKELTRFSALSFQEIDALTSELEESDNEEIKKKAGLVRIALANALIEQNRALDKE